MKMKMSSLQKGTYIHSKFLRKLILGSEVHPSSNSLIYRWNEKTAVFLGHRQSQMLGSEPISFFHQSKYTQVTRHFICQSTF